MNKDKIHYAHVLRMQMSIMHMSLECKCYANLHLGRFLKTHYDEIQVNSNCNEIKSLI